LDNLGTTSGPRVAIDVGGTFIDFVMVDGETGELVIEKQPSTPSRLVENLIEGLDGLPREIGSISQIFHGTTVAINAILQMRGVPVGLLTTEGFRDVLALTRGGRGEIYNLFFNTTPPLVPRAMRLEVGGRIDADGVEVAPLDEDAVVERADELVARGAEAIAICLLHSYANPAHEERVAELVRRRHPEVSVTASHELITEWREYERTSTTVLNAYVQPSFERYVGDLVAALAERGYDRRLALMQSNGGVISGGSAMSKPIRTLVSGPAGGVIGAASLAKELVHPNVICADVGGTSYDVALIEDGKVLERTETVVEGRPIMGPIIDIVSIGSGGGSIAWIDHRGALQVGPKSAGADPGPVAFGKGGTEPTVTDAHLLLGRLDPERFLGSRMRLDLEAASEAMRTHVADPLELTVEEAAAGALAIATTSMTYAIRGITVERGLDPREFVMYSYGGGGGLFAADVAEHSEVGRVIVPRAPANFSAWGILTSDYREDAVRTRVMTLDETTIEDVRDTLRELVDHAATAVRGYGFDDASLEESFHLDLRYAGQDSTVQVSVDADWLGDGEELLSRSRNAFVMAHRQLYGHGDMDAKLELVHCRAHVVGRVDAPVWPRWSIGEPARPREVRPVYFHQADGLAETAVFDREELAVGQQVSGPAIVEEWTTTTLVPPGWHLAVDELGNLVITRERS
jgi:N-methylhydantoinase A